MDLPILNILRSQVLIPEHQHILRILLFGCFGKFEASSDNRFSLYNHDLIMNDGIG
jgi:hypothetical protein